MTRYDRRFACDECTVDPGAICWPIPTDVCCDCLDLDDADDAARFAAAWQIASSYVYGRTCQRWPGCCWAEAVMPCMAACGHHLQCRCGGLVALDITDAFCLPICGEVRVDLLETSCRPASTWIEGNEFWIERHNGRTMLVLDQGDGCCYRSWPSSIVIRANTGCTPPPEILSAVAAFACEIVKECVATGCSLPVGARSVQRRGVSIEIDTDGSGPGLSLRMLDEMFDRYACEPGDFEAFTDPDPVVTWRRLGGVERVAD